MIRHWTKEKCKEEALKYNIRSEFAKNSKGAYESSRKNGWSEDICSHMIKIVEDKWTKERCIGVVEKCHSIRDFREIYNSAYQSCIRNKWIGEICINLHRDFKIAGYWTKEKCIESALNCDSKNEFKNKYPTAYSKSVENR